MFSVFDKFLCNGPRNKLLDTFGPSQYRDFDASALESRLIIPISFQSRLWRIPLIAHNSVITRATARLLSNARRSGVQ